MKLEDFKTRVDSLILLATKTIDSQRYDQDAGEVLVDEELFQQLRVSGLSFLDTVFGRKHIIYKDFEEKVDDNILYNTKQGKGILNAAKTEIDGGWLFGIRGIVSAEIFSDFFEMASHLLSENYKDAAAVMVGSTLEEHLRQLCTKNSIPLSTPHPTKPGVIVHKKAEVMNAELTKAGVYKLLDQKQITAWLDLRNNAAHGHYTVYDQRQVEDMRNGVVNFITRVP